MPPRGEGVGERSVRYPPPNPILTSKTEGNFEPILKTRGEFLGMGQKKGLRSSNFSSWLRGEMVNFSVFLDFLGSKVKKISNGPSPTPPPLLVGGEEGGRKPLQSIRCGGGVSEAEKKTPWYELVRGRERATRLPFRSPRKPQNFLASSSTLFESRKRRSS